MPTPLSRDHLEELHCIQPITNVRSILERGILSNYAARRIAHDSVADPRIQARREPVVVPGTEGRKLHSYANLYINARNKMLSRIKFERGDTGICVLRVALTVLDLPGVVISTQNASSDYARFARSPDGLAHIDKDLVFALSWKHPDDQIAEWKHGSIMCAEVLVPNCVPPEYIEGAYVSCEEAADALLDAVQQDRFVVTVNRHLFFR